MKFTRFGTVIAASAASALVLVSCAAEENDSADLQTIKVSRDASTSGAGIVLGMEQGFFEEEGLNIEIVGELGNPPAAVAALQSNEIDIASVPLIPGINAQSQSINVTSIAPVVGYPEDVENNSEFDTYGVYVAPDSGISSAGELEGKRVAVNARKAIFEAFVTDEVMNEGGDPADVEWIALDFPSQVEALKNGEVDAITLPLPFTLQAEEDGAEMLWSPGVAFYESGPTSTWMASPEVAADPEIVEKFQRGIEKSNAYANDHRDEAIEVAAEMTGIDAGLLANSGKFNYFPTQMSSDDIRRVSEKLVDIEFIEAPLAMDDSIIISAE